MAAPINTYESTTDLSLGQVPQVDDPELYTALLDIHNAIESLLKGSDEGSADFTEFLAKYRNITSIAEDYLVLITDGTILVDTTASPVVVTLPPIVDILGYRFNVKKVESSAVNKATLVGDGAELIDGHAAGICISTNSSYTVVATDTGWSII